MTTYIFEEVSRKFTKEGNVLNVEDIIKKLKNFHRQLIHIMF